LLSVLANFKTGKRIVLKQSKPLVSGNYDSGEGTSSINPLKHKKINVTFSSHVVENAVFINSES
jgi:hypothetical protein